MSVVVASYAQPNIKYTLVGTAGGNDPDTGDIYRGFDRFGRVNDAYWYNTGTSTDAARIQYGYDRAGNRTFRYDVVAHNNSAAFDEIYDYDAVQRLKDMARGTLNAGRTALTTETFAQCWTLDETGNWTGFREDDNGDGTWDLVQSRTSNTVNEITGITNSTGSAWTTPTYNPAGNMTTMPQPAAPASSYTATYDAWNRLVSISTSGTSVSSYVYDGAKRRTLQLNYIGGVLSETRHYYYTQRWQVTEERLGTTPNTATPDRQFFWGLRYIDDLILRDRSTGGGTLNERLYGMQDGNWNVIALCDTSGTIQERYVYTAYGMPMFLSPAFASQANSNFAWETLYCAYRYEFVTGLMHVRHRVYQPAVGVWLQRDPVGFVDGANLYRAYFAVRTTDPYGLWIPWCPWNSCQQFDEWYATENKIGTGWAASLPACPCKVTFTYSTYYTCSTGGSGYSTFTRHSTQNINNPDPKVWDKPDDSPNLWGNYHPGASGCIRSIPAPGTTSSEQCCYDGSGSLITDAPGAGTADKSGPGSGVGKHLDADVYPYDWALCCDGGKAGAKVQLYYKVRPTSSKPCV